MKQVQKMTAETMTAPAASVWYQVRKTASRKNWMVRKLLLKMSGQASETSSRSPPACWSIGSADDSSPEGAACPSGTESPPACAGGLDISEVVMALLMV